MIFDSDPRAELVALATRLAATHDSELVQYAGMPVLLIRARGHDFYRQRMQAVFGSDWRAAVASLANDPDVATPGSRTLALAAELQRRLPATSSHNNGVKK